MRHRIGFVVMVVTLGICATPDLFACGEKFLVAGRGTRYQRPKNARAASVLIYANPSTGLMAALKNVKVESVLKHEGHQSTTVETPEQLSTVLGGGRFDVVLAASRATADVEKLLGSGPDRAVVVGVESPANEGSLLKAIDKAVEQHDKARKAATRS
jgi:hypothetical protein